MAQVVRALGDGLYVGDYFDGNERLDVILRSTDWPTPEHLMATPIATPDGNVQPLGELVTLRRTAGPDQIRRVDRRRTITLEVTPPANMAMEPGNYIAHNYFSDLSRNGIFAFRNQGGNIIEYNHIHDAMKTTVDGACIHFATMNPGNQL